MTNPTKSVLLLLLVFCCELAGSAQKGARARPSLAFHISPINKVFEFGANVTLEFTLKNISNHRVLATREASLHDLIYLDILDSRGKKLNWEGKIVNRAYPPEFFVILSPGQSSTFRAVISSSGGSGYDITEVGTYRVQALFSLAPKEYFLPVSDGAVVSDTPVNSNWTQFSIRPATP